MRTKLNGWQRLWIIVSVIYLLLVVLFTWISWPTAKEIESSWLYSLIEATKDPGDYSYQIREAYQDVPDRELIRRINEKYAEQKDYKEELQKINQRYQKQLASLGRNRLTSLGIAFMAWIIPIGMVYLLGLAVGWIHKGFQNK